MKAFYLAYVNQSMEKLKCEMSTTHEWYTTVFMISGLTLIQSLVDDILKQLDDLYMLGRLLGASWNDCETKAAKFHCVNKITRSIATARHPSDRVCAGNGQRCR